MLNIQRYLMNTFGLVVILASVVTTISKAAEVAGIRIVDEATGRGVPLVELETTHGIRYVTDNAGLIAIIDPDVIGEETFFSVIGHGYEFPKDPFGFSGKAITVTPGRITEIKVQRQYLGERLCRLTGVGLYRDSELLGMPANNRLQPVNGMVVGQDSIQSVLYRDKVFCMWGDTSRLSYPLGMFRMAGATYDLTDKTSNGRLDPQNGLPFEYFVDPTSGFARAMMPLAERPEGVVWIDGLAVTKSADGKETMVAHYSRRKGLAEELEHGLAKYDDAKSTFEVLEKLDDPMEWRHPHGHAVNVQDGDESWLYFGNPFPTTRVPDTLAAVQDIRKYESFSPLTADANSYNEWNWSKTATPFGAKEEFEWFNRKKRRVGEDRYLPVNSADPQERIFFHSGSLHWNAYRQKWIVIGCRIYGKDTLLGEVWYTEGDSPTGPFRRAIKIASHDKQSFYNVCHHDYLDRDGGRIVHFEGTFTNSFSGNPYQTPRYNYNQVLYRLDLSQLPNLD